MTNLSNYLSYSEIVCIIIYTIVDCEWKTVQQISAL